jgi:hypothetical protein
MAAALAVAAVACSSEGPQGPMDPPAALIVETPGSNLNVQLCKISNDAATEGVSFDFTVTATDGTPSDLTLTAQPLVPLNVDLCGLAWLGPDRSYDDETAITITEVVPAGYRLVQITFQGTDLFGTYPKCEDNGGVQPCVPADRVDENGLDPSITFTPLDGLTVFFKNIQVEEPPPPPGDEGCTPGYWKNHLDSWVPTGYAPGQTVGSVFTGSLYDATTLQAALDFGGGSGVAGAQRILLRAAVAGLLNAAHPDVNYTMSVSDLIDAVDAALASGDRDTMLALAASIDFDNNLGCPLN